MQNLGDIPADNRTSTRIGMDVDLHYGLTGLSFCTTANEKVYIAARAAGESANDGFWQEHVEARTLVLMKGKLGRRDRFWIVGQPEAIQKRASRKT